MQRRFSRVVKLTYGHGAGGTLVQTVKTKLQAAAIGNPSRYGIAFVTEGSTGGRLVFFDRAPNKGFVRHEPR